MKQVRSVEFFSQKMPLSCGTPFPSVLVFVVIRVAKFFTKTREISFHGQAPFWYGLGWLCVFMIELARCVKSAVQLAADQNLSCSQLVYLVYEWYL